MEAREAIAAIASGVLGLYVLGGFIYVFATRASFYTIGKFLLGLFMMASILPLLIFFSETQARLEVEEQEQAMLTLLSGSLILFSLFAWLWNRAASSPKKDDWVDDPPTPRQLAYISALMDEREVEEPIEEPTTKLEASMLIEKLKALKD